MALPTVRQLISTTDQVVANIKRFNADLKSSPRLHERLGMVHAWYALRGADGRWLFGPSKFVGYRNNSAEDYLKTAKSNADGRETEQALKVLFAEPVDPDSRPGRSVMEALTEWLNSQGSSLRKGARITIVADETRPDAALKTKSTASLLSRIVSDPAICGGRPCIKGTRTRVSDILAMLAHGIGSEEILADYPWLAPEDIAASLAYAAQAADHLIIRAA